MQSELDARLEAVHRQLSSRNINLPPEDVLNKQVLEQLNTGKHSDPDGQNAEASALMTGLSMMRLPESPSATR